MRQKMGKLHIEAYNSDFRLIAVEKYRAIKPQYNYDLILLDLDMPIMTGFEACRMIRLDKGYGGGEAIKNLLQIEKENVETYSQEEIKL
jgi:CheY-like chemotaxis protein